ncbi:MAG: hypothetical protein WCA07_11775 [Gloeobacterales cyanobacterium]|jgi:hypothetical protein
MYSLNSSQPEISSSPVEVLYGPWHGQRGLIRAILSPYEWLVSLDEEDDHGEVLLALEKNQFRTL